jgi:hypothetical protein
MRGLILRKRAAVGGGRGHRVVAVCGCLVSLGLGCISLKSGDQIPDQGSSDSMQGPGNDAGDAVGPDAAPSRDAAAGEDASVGADTGSSREGSADAGAPTDRGTLVDQDAPDGDGASLSQPEASYAEAALGESAVPSEGAVSSEGAVPSEGAVSSEDASLGETPSDASQGGDGLDAWSFIALDAIAPDPSAPWVPIPGCASDISAGWMIGCDHSSLSEWNPSMGDWEQVPGISAYKVNVDLNGTPWVVRSDGQILKWNGTAFAAFGGDGGLCAMDIASGSSDDETWALECDTGAVWNWSGSRWVNVPGAGVKVSVSSSVDPACGAHFPLVIGTTQALFVYSCSTHALGYNLEGGLAPSVLGSSVDLSTDAIVDTNGQIELWSGFPDASNESAWTTMGPAPWGTSTRIGTGRGWMFAMSLDTGAVMMKDGL